MLRYEVPLAIGHPFHGEALLRFLGRHAVAGVEAYQETFDDGGVTDDGEPRLHYARTLTLDRGPAVLELSWASGRLTAAAQLIDPADYDTARQRIEHLCDLGRDVGLAERWLSRDRQLAPLIAASPGLRVPGTVDAHEQLFRTMIGQQISLAGAASLTGKLVLRFGHPWAGGLGSISTAAGPLTHLFPTSNVLAGADPATLPMPAARGRALVAAAQALATGDLVLETASDPAEIRGRLLALGGVGPWTADYVAMRALHAPDVLLGSDLVIRRELLRRGLVDTDPWSPWRSYATVHLWRGWTG